MAVSVFFGALMISCTLAPPRVDVFPSIVVACGLIQPYWAETCTSRRKESD
jgi:hypothetical protein